MMTIEKRKGETSGKVRFSQRGGKPSTAKKMTMKDVPGIGQK